MIDPSEFGRFLRARREALQPEDVGLPAGLRRRAPGLRREEVAQLSSMSADYYTRIEQGRGPQPSAAMLSAIARALRMTADERDHLFRLAGHNPPDRTRDTTHVAPGLQRVLDRLSDTPAFVLSDLGEMLAFNRLVEPLFGAAPFSSGPERSAVYRWFVHPDTERLIYPEEDRPRQGRALVASLRMALGRRGPSSPAADLVHALTLRSDEFADLWSRQEAELRYEDRKTIVHPEIGAIDFDCQALFTEDQSQTLIVLTVPARSAEEDKVKLLALLGTSRFAENS
jgi:transcriptional regulator with XRE-family HTH domain